MNQFVCVCVTVCLCECVCVFVFVPVREKVIFCISSHLKTWMDMLSFNTFYYTIFLNKAEQKQELWNFFGYF